MAQPVFLRLGDPADPPTGPLFLAGDEVVFNYEIKNNGNVGLTNVVVTDNVLGLVSTFVNKGNGDSALEEPRGITTDPNGGSTLWIVDNKTEKVYQFNNATGILSGSKSSDAVFSLAPSNTSPEGIADPPFLATAQTGVGSTEPISASLNPLHRSTNPLDVVGSGIVSTLDALPAINALNFHAGNSSAEPTTVFATVGMSVDVGGNDSVSALDVLVIMNELSQRHDAKGGFNLLSDDLELHLDSTDAYFSDFADLDAFEYIRRRRV